MTRLVFADTTDNVDMDANDTIQITIHITSPKICNHIYKLLEYNSLFPNIWYIKWPNVPHTMLANIRMHMRTCMLSRIWDCPCAHINIINPPTWTRAQVQRNGNNWQIRFIRRRVPMPNHPYYYYKYRGPHKRVYHNSTIFKICEGKNMKYKIPTRKGKKIPGS